MIRDFIDKLKALPHLKLFIIIFTVWQYFSVLGMAVLNWSTSLVWLNLGLLLAFIVLCPIYESLLLLILSIPFYVVIPNSRFDSLSMWRVLFLALFAVWLIRDKKLFLPSRFGGVKRVKDVIFMPWDKYLAWFVVVGVALAFIFGQYKIYIYNGRKFK